MSPHPVAVGCGGGTNWLRVCAFNTHRPTHALVSHCSIPLCVARSLAGRYSSLADVKIAGQSFGLRLARFNRRFSVIR